MNTLAELKALTRAQCVDGNSYYISGYYAAGDGGGGAFVYDATSEAADDGGSVIEPTHGIGRFARTFEPGPISVKLFGAKGDNATDDHDAIQAAINILGSDGVLAITGGVIYFPPGNYRTTATIHVTKAAVTLLGAGHTGLYAVSTGTGSRLIGVLPTLGTDPIVQVSGDFCTLQGLGFALNAAPGQAGFDSVRTSGAAVLITAGATRMTVERCYFSWQNKAIEGSDFSQIYVRDCVFYQIVGYAIDLNTYDGADDATADRNSAWIQGCEFNNIGPVETGSSAAAEGAGVYIRSGGGFLAADCYFLDVERGIKAKWEVAAQASIHFRVLGCTFDVPQEDDAKHIELDGNVLSSVACINTIISGCTFNISTSGGGSGGYGIDITGRFYGGVISACAFNCYWIGINFGATSRWTVSGCTFSGGASPVQIGHANASLINITGCVFPATTDDVTDGSTGGSNFVAANKNANNLRLVSPTPTLPASDAGYTNRTNKPTWVSVSGGTVTAIKINDNALGITSGLVPVGPGDVIKVTYSSAPTWTWFTA